ncbi:PaaI family thioesterase [Limibacillus halophilus]|jgi:uncharacterized protein (TIGR00369 family)
MTNSAPPPKSSQGPEAFRAILQAVFGGEVPHVKALGITVEDFEGPELLMRLPYAVELVGDPDSGVLHGGAVTTLIDSACGLGVIAALETPRPVATLDLRIDYLRPAEAGRDLYCRAACYRVTRQVAFARASAFHLGEEEEPVAAALGSFMLTDLPSAGNDS